ncbi:hypothetical protein SASPL_146890 [Salvia splendens]|uniref:Transmembrane protein n=1 Tax=Salvia splendens TaxID=180675 RepID=A0A8X8Z5M3_SALSN|nr:hypothetical protein SASPL_146890 [Salvia splendens]
MADDTAPKQPNGDEYSDHPQDLTLLNRLIAAIFFPSPNSSPPLLHRIKTALAENVPLLRDASKNTAARVLQWTRRGSPLRALLVVSVGTIVFLTLAGLLVFMLFFVAATVNAVVISLVMSLAAAGGFLAIFFACVAAIYIGALSVAIFVISAATISCIIAVLIAAVFFLLCISCVMLTADVKIRLDWILLYIVDCSAEKHRPGQTFHFRHRVGSFSLLIRLARQTWPGLNEIGLRPHGS